MMTTTATSAVRGFPFRLRLPFRGDTLSSVALIVVILFVLLAIFAPLLPLGSPVDINAGPRLSAPSWHLLAGTDNLGRSLLPRIAQSIRTTFVVALVAVGIGLVVGVLVGMIAAYYRGVADELISRSADIFFVFPGLVLALLIVAIVGPGEKGAIITVAILSVPMMVRVIRAASLRVMSRDFVLAAKVGGASSRRILLVHVLPNVAGTAVVQGTFTLSIAMLVESALSFLGLSVQPPQASLGSLVYEGSLYLPIAPWFALIPGVVLALLVVSVNLLGDGLRDALDVRAVEVRR